MHHPWCTVRRLGSFDFDKLLCSAGGPLLTKNHRGMTHTERSEISFHEPDSRGLNRSFRHAGESRHPGL
jgi:hypothetical protein